MSQNRNPSLESLQHLIPIDVWWVPLRDSLSGVTMKFGNDTLTESALVLAIGFPAAELLQ